MANRKGPRDVMELEHRDAPERGASRPVVRGAQGIAAAGHYLTAMSAMRMLLSGGNAFDAAAAAGFAAAVVEPTASYSLCTEGSFMLYHSATGRVQALSGQGVAPGRATVDFFRDKGLDKIPTGPGPNAELSFTVPGVVDALLTMLETYGTKTVSEVMAPAMEYAQGGFPMYAQMRRSLQSEVALEQFHRYPPGGTEVFYPGGQPLREGELLVQAKLAATLLQMVEGASRAGHDRQAGIQAARDVFYRGDIARTIVACSQRVGGLFALEDLAEYHARLEDPLRTTFMGHEVCAQSTWTQGALLLQALNILEHFDLGAMGHNSVQHIHTVAEALKLALADRERHYGDPEFAKVPTDGLVSKAYAAQRAALIDAGVACPELPEAGDPWRFSSLGPAPFTPMPQVATTVSGGDGGASDNSGTTHFAVIDRDGNMVAATPSGGVFAKSVYFPELGASFSTRSEMFFLDPGHPNGLQPGKRPRTTLVNYMVCKDGVPVMTAGCPGGDAQAQANLQLILNVLVFGMDPQQAVEAPRFASASVTNSFYPRVYLPGQLDVEPGIPSDVRSKLAEMGHKIVEASSCGAGAIVTRRDPETGSLAAGADPRRTTYAVAM